MELLCIETHPERVVIAGNTYPLISDKPKCRCNDVFDVGIKNNICILNNKETVIKAGIPVVCTHCNTEYMFDGVWWIAKARFGEIGTIDENSQYQEKRELVKVREF